MSPADDFKIVAAGATAELPLNYHDPNGARTTVAPRRIKAKDPVQRLGTLFVNPGGPVTRPETPV